MFLRGEGFYSHYFLIPKTKDGLISIFRSRRVKQVPEGNKVLHSYPSFHYFFPGTRGLVCCPQFTEHLLPYRDLSKPLQVSQVCSEWNPLPTHSTSIWPIHSPLCFHKVHGSGSCVSEETGNPCIPYLDDWLVRGQSKSQVLSSMTVIIQATFSALGLLLNLNKSFLKTVYRTEFTGTLMDVMKAKVFLPQSRFQVDVWY